MRQGIAFFGMAAVLSAAIVLSGCSREDETAPAALPPPEVPAAVKLTPVGFEALPGWSDDPVIKALPALRRSCGVFAKKPSQAWLGLGQIAGTYEDWQGLCAELSRALPPGNETDETALRAWLEERFQPYALTAADGTANGTFTGYYEAALRGAREKAPGYETPLYGVPPDLVTVDLGDSDPQLKGKKVVGRIDGTEVKPYWTRQEIEDGALDGAASVVLWAADPVDAHILHIQGSGQVSLPDGTIQRVGYAGNNGHGFVGVGSEMMRRGLLEPGKASMPHIRTWLKANPDKAREVMQANPRYIFFREIQGEGPIGAFGVPLTPRRSIAVDTRYVPLGIPLWLDSVDPDGLPLERLMVAQDIGSAIKGVVRGDFFWGPGEPALEKAGRMKSQGQWYVLLPKARMETPIAQQ